MYRLAVVATVAAVLFAALPGVVAVGAPSRSRSYIVVLRDSAVRAGQVRATTEELARGHGLKIRNVYERVLHGFAARIPEADVRACAATRGWPPSSATVA
jgi:hypothetical protein